MNGRAIYVGTAGEHLVCADLICEGFNAFLSSAGLPYDVVVDIDGAMIRVGVRSTLKARPRSGRKLTRPCYQFNIMRAGKQRYTKDEIDVMALVALDRKLIAYIAVEDMPTIMHIDEPGPVRYPNHKGPKPGQCKRFEDFPLTEAVERCLNDTPR